MTTTARHVLAVAALAVALAACGGDDDAPAVGDLPPVTPEGIPAERCDANRAAGEITYLSGFDFAATAGIVEVTVADARGYFDAMCLDVRLRSSFSVQNYPLVASGEAQFASAGSYSEMLQFAEQNDTEFVAVIHDGKTGIDALVVTPESGITAPADVAGKTLGVKGKITPSVQAMLARAGLEEGRDYTTVLLDGFDPKVHIRQPIDGFPVYKSNEPGQLERAGEAFALLDPSAEGIPGSFGIVYTSASFAADHPTATVDFVRAAMRGMEDALADPASAVAISLEKIREGGNQNFLSDEGESYRWQVEADLVRTTSAASSAPVGALVPSVLRDEVEGLTEAGVFAEAPALEGTYDDTIAAEVYGDDGRVVWPAG